MVNTADAFWNGDTPEEWAFFQSEPRTFERVAVSREFRVIVGASVAAFMTALYSSSAFAKDVYRQKLLEEMAGTGGISGSRIEGANDNPGLAYFTDYNAELAAAVVAKILVDSVIPDRWKSFEKAIVAMVLIVGYFLVLGVDGARDGEVDLNRALLGVAMATQLGTHLFGPDKGDIAEKHFSLKGHVLPQVLVTNICAALQYLFKL